jgi:hypothetical protein
MILERDFCMYTQDHEMESRGSLGTTDTQIEEMKYRILNYSPHAK